MSQVNVICDGYVQSPPKFLITKDGRRYCTFRIGCSNNSKKNGEVQSGDFVYYDCYVQDSPVYKLLQNLSISKADRVLIFGKLFVQKVDGVYYLKIYVTSFEIIYSKSAFENYVNEVGTEAIVSQKSKSFNGSTITDSNEEIDF